jgi:hypothetical protein
MNDPDLRVPLWKEILLWIAILPGAFLAAGVVCVVVIWCGRFMAADLFSLPVVVPGWTDGLEKYLSGQRSVSMWIVAAVAYVSTGWAFVFVGASIAPRANTVVAVVLAALVLFVAGGYVLIIVRLREWLGLFSVIAITLGAVVTAAEYGKPAKRY